MQANNSSFNSPYVIKSDNTSAIIKAAKKEINKQKLLLEAHLQGLYFLFFLHKFDIIN